MGIESMADHSVEYFGLTLFGGVLAFIVALMFF